MAMDTEESLREYLRLQLKVPLIGRIGPVARTFDFVADAAPGVKEILTVGKLCHEVRERHYDLIVVDASATGHVVGQLAAPQAINELVKVGPCPRPDALDGRHPRRPAHDGGGDRDLARGDAGGRDASSWPSGSGSRPTCTSPRWWSTACCPSCSVAARRRCSTGSASRRACGR